MRWRELGRVCSESVVLEVIMTAAVQSQCHASSWSRGRRGAPRGVKLQQGKVVRETYSLRFYMAGTRLL